MKPDADRNIGHSIFQKMLNHARRTGDDFNLLLARYAVERFLYRLSISGYHESCISVCAACVSSHLGKQ